MLSTGKNHKWPKSGYHGYLTPAISGVLSAHHGEKNQKWPKSGQNGYFTAAFLRGGGGTCGRDGCIGRAVLPVSNMATKMTSVGLVEKCLLRAVLNRKKRPLKDCPAWGSPKLAQNQK